MSSTITLGNSIEYVQRFIRNSPLTFVGSGDPAFGSGDWVRDFILSPPFAWKWNRGYVPTITCTEGVSDYVANVPDFGWIEKATLHFPIIQGQPQQAVDLSNENVLSAEAFENQPREISAQLDDNNGNITFRLFPPPDTPYTLYIIYQKAAPRFTSLQQTWSPLPDYMSYLYHQGLKALAYEYIDDQRFAFSIQLFLQQLVATSTGLSETQKNIFLEQRMNTLREQIAVQTGKR